MFSSGTVQTLLKPRVDSPLARTKHAQLEAAIKELQHERWLITKAITAIEQLRALRGR